MALPLVSPSPERGPDPEQEPHPLTLPVTSLDEQYRRQHISQEWQPQGFARYRQQKALLDQMSVLGGPGENGGASPERFAPVSSSLEDFPKR